MIERLDPGLFDWHTWRAGTPADVFGVPCRTQYLVAAAPLLRAHAVGYCRGDAILCRPRPDSVAVMFYSDGRHFWFHLRMAEARAILGEELR